jgi:tetratricopeptide (TPR) repeat protein
MKLDIGTARRLSAATLGIGFCVMAAGSAFAMGSSTPDTPTCPKGQVYNSTTKKCEQQRSEALPDTDLVNYAYALAKKEQRYEEAIEVLNLMKNPNTAQALNYRGYATRQLGKLDEGIAYYQQSIKRDPRYALVREYLGEAYVLKGDLASAKYQLRKIEGICGNTQCEEYAYLAEAIADGPNACGGRYAAKRCASGG